MLNTFQHQTNRVGDTVLAASRQVWLAGLGAAVVTRDWAEKEAAGVFRTLVKEGHVEQLAVEHEGKRERTRYKITRSGRRYFEELLRRARLIAAAHRDSAASQGVDRGSWSGDEVRPDFREKATANVEPPKTLNWDMWCGPAPMRAFNKKIHPRGFRQFLDYANGQQFCWALARPERPWMTPVRGLLTMAKREESCRQGERNVTHAERKACVRSHRR